MRSKSTVVVDFVRRLYAQPGLQDDFLRDPERALAQEGLDEENRRTLRSLAGKWTVGTPQKPLEDKSWW